MCCRQRIECAGVVRQCTNRCSPSSTVTHWNWLNDAVEGFGEEDVGGASDVVDRTQATSSPKTMKLRSLDVSGHLAVETDHQSCMKTAAIQQCLS